MLFKTRLVSDEKVIDGLKQGLCAPLQVQKEHDDTVLALKDIPPNTFLAEFKTERLYSEDLFDIKESQYTVNDKELIAIRITFYDKELSSWLVPEDSMK